MKPVYRVAVGLVWLVATLIVGAAATTGNAAPSRVTDAGSVVGQSGDGMIADNQLGVYGAYMDQRASVDRSHIKHSNAGGIVGWLADHELGVAVITAFLWVAIGIWVIERGFKIPHTRRRPD